MLAALLLAGCGRDEAGTAEPRVKIAGAYVRLSPVPANPSAGYFTARSNNDPTKLVAVTSPKVGRIELHGTTMTGGIMRMAPLANDELVFEDGAGDGASIDFAPGGKHLMLYDVAPDVRPGTRVPLTFRFEPAMTVTVQAEVRAAGDAGGHGMAH